MLLMQQASLLMTTLYQCKWLQTNTQPSNVVKTTNVAKKNTKRYSNEVVLTQAALWFIYRLVQSQDIHRPNRLVWNCYHTSISAASGCTVH